jgi:predicted RND superfamily exporter protein
MEWKGNTALGKYYLTLPNDSTKSAYIQAVKEWGPTILPSTFNSIKHKNINYISYSASSEIKRYIEDNKIEAIVVSIGSNADITKIPIYKSVDMSPIISNVPKLYKEFKMSNGLYVTGTLAVDYGGPRQGSLVSTGDTSRAILNDIKENANI